MNGPEAPYSIGSRHMPGLAKLVEEMAELSEVLAKFMGNGGDPEYFGRFNLDDRLEEEIADVEAALQFFKARNLRGPDAFERIRARAEVKYTQFCHWHWAAENADPGLPGCESPIHPHPGPHWHAQPLPEGEVAGG